ncbi:hypothetical protein CDAR_120311 [Caerostris darwini]|uniref:Uncharacterized protein n=1 Tax=Caerostris darwini TaxID=1538125 RepID=A0AAV4TA70_9ARAC|nr:hypothetical protein CDAR_120311 [Caerostris darwini]
MRFQSKNSESLIVISSRLLTALIRPAVHENSIVTSKKFLPLRTGNDFRKAGRKNDRCLILLTVLGRRFAVAKVPAGAICRNCAQVHGQSFPLILLFGLGE